MMRMAFHLLPRSRSARVFWLTVTIIFIVDILVMLPGMGQQWRNCLRYELTRTEMVVKVIASQPAGNPANPAARAALSNSSGAVAITLMGGAGDRSILLPGKALRPGLDIDLDSVSLSQSIGQAGREVLGFGAPYLAVDAAFPLGSAMRIELIVSATPVIAHLRNYVAQTAMYSIIVAIITGSLVYAALDRLLVKPMRIMTANIVAFRRDPEYARLSGLKWLSRKGDDEIAKAARELVIMQEELRTALWRNAQLAALGTAIAKISHDLRNTFASALLVAERLRTNDDPAIQQASSSLISSIERAVELVTRTVDSTGGRSPAVTRAPLVLHKLVDEVADFIRQGATALAIDNLVPKNLVLPLDRNQIYRVLVNLLRNAAEAQASYVALTVENENGVTQLVITDNGPGLPRKALAGLFRPFAGSGRNGGTGLGLAIARDLIRAHGGDLLLRKTGASGTVFVMSLPANEIPNADSEQSPANL